MKKCKHCGNYISTEERYHHCSVTNQIYDDNTIEDILIASSLYIGSSNDNSSDYVYDNSSDSTPTDSGSTTDFGGGSGGGGGGGSDY